MRCFQISMEKIRVEDALDQIDALKWIEPKQRNILRLLAEEMFSMMKNVLQNHEASFELLHENNVFSLSLDANVKLDDKAKKAFLSVSTDGKNRAYRGLSGKLTAMLDSFAASDDYYVVEGFEQPTSPMNDYAYLWSMSHYMDVVGDAQKAKDWDGMEKSIIANFADDVLIGVSSRHLEMIVKKKF